MLPFSIEFRPGESLVDQIVYAVKRALVTGVFRPGDRFPSVRALSQELRIHPTTAHKAVALLVEEGILKVEPGIGTVIAARPAAPPSDEEVLGDEAERLVIEAKRLRLTLTRAQEILAAHWRRLS